MMKFSSTSQCHQDTFAFQLIGEHGAFLDLGASHPVERSNTCSLERIGWGGWLVERDLNAVAMLSEQRTAQVSALDLTQPNEGFWMELPTVIDYLSLDVDENTLRALIQVPLNRIRFRVITIEHDAYRFGDTPRSQMRNILSGRGYRLVRPDVSDMGMAFEDWWVAPELEDMARKVEAPL